MDLFDTNVYVDQETRDKLLESAESGKLKAGAARRSVIHLIQHANFMDAWNTRQHDQNKELARESVKDRKDVAAEVLAAVEFALGTVTWGAGEFMIQREPRCPHCEGLGRIPKQEAVEVLDPDSTETTESA